MPLTSRHRAFVDANVLASPVPRTILYLSQPLSDFELVFSPWVEREAERHQKPRHIPVSTLRERFDWMVVPDADRFDAFVDTDVKDRPVFAAFDAHEALFGPPSPDTSHRPPIESYRGTRCVRCFGSLPVKPQRQQSGLCRQCV